jgi:hypothetical protein
VVRTKARRNPTVEQIDAAETCRPTRDRRSLRGLRGPGRFPAAATECGGIVGSVVGPGGEAVPARVLLHGRHGTVAECRLSQPRGGWGPGRFEVSELPPGCYVLEIEAPDCVTELCEGVRVDAACVTHIGRVQLERARAPDPAR